MVNTYQYLDHLMFPIKHNLPRERMVCVHVAFKSDKASSEYECHKCGVIISYQFDALGTFRSRMKSVCSVMY